MRIHYRTQSFIFKREDLRETDQLFTVYTKDFGKLKILGKAIRKIKSKLRGSFQLFCLSEIEFIQGKTYKTLTDAILIKNFSELKKDLIKLKTTYRIAEILDSLVKGEEKDERIWELLNEVFEKLNNSSSFINCSFLYYYFLWNLLSVLGYKPELYNCALCQKKLILEKLYWSPKEGGVVCNNCSKKIKTQLSEIDPDMIKILRLILERDWSVLKRLKIEKEKEKKLEQLSVNFPSFVLG